MTDRYDEKPYQAHLAAWRELRGMTQEEVGEALGVSHTTIGRWESGGMKITSGSLVSLCHLYEVSPQQLLSPPSDAPTIRRIVEMEGLIKDMDDDAYEHLVGVAKRMK